MLANSLNRKSVGARRQIGLVAALAASVAAFVILGAAPQANAASWSTCNLAYAGVCGTTNAYLEVTCRTDLNFDGTKTWMVTALSTGNGWDASIAFQARVAITGYKEWALNWQYTSWGNTTYVYGLRVPQSATAKTVTIREQFAYAPYGYWIYSPNGQFEYAVHKTSGPTVGSVGTGNSCTLR
jgi:hypothetical protein